MAANVLFGDGGRYDPKPFETILKNEFSVNSKPLTLRDAKTQLCIPAMNINNDEVMIYKSPLNKPSTNTSDKSSYNPNIPMWEIARATCAAPTLFCAAKVDNSYYLDGGIWANNPSLLGVVEAKKCGYSFEQIKILSFGTGTIPFHNTMAKTENLNLVNLGVNGFLELSIEAQSQSTHNITASLLPKEQYFRLQYNFKKYIALDDTTHLDTLKAAGYELYIKYGDAIKKKFFTI
jgi:patatin-like phospholipase/acyl hydrolase